MNILKNLFGKKSEEQNAERVDEKVTEKQAVNKPQTTNNENHITPSQQAAADETEPSEPMSEELLFTMLIDGMLPLQSGDIEVKGHVMGQCSLGEKVYICGPNFVEEGEVTFIENETHVSVSQVANQEARIVLKGVSDYQSIRSMMALTNIQPMRKVDVAQSIENPYLKALIQDSERFYQNETFLSLISFMVCHTHYITHFDLLDANGQPIEHTPTDEPQTFETQEGSKLQFYWLKNGETPMFPLFTDWRSLNKAKVILPENQQPKAMIITFQDVVAMLRQMGGGGIVINPFDEPNFNLSPEFIKSIVESEGYRQEFVKSEEK